VAKCRARAHTWKRWAYWSSATSNVAGPSVQSAGRPSMQTSPTGSKKIAHSSAGALWYRANGTARPSVSSQVTHRVIHAADACLKHGGRDAFNTVV
jgi:hypothetical protein